MGIQWRARVRGGRTAGRESRAPAGPRRPALRTFPAWALAGAAIPASAAVLAAMTVLAGGGPTAAAGQRARGAAAPDGTISTVAGGVGGPAAATKVNLGVSTPLAGTANSPCGVSFALGQLFIADNWTVRSVSPLTGGLTTPAGTAASGPFSDGSPAAGTSLDTCAVAADSAGNLVIADVADNRIRVVAAADGTFYGQQMTAGDVYTVAGDGDYGFSGDGGPATSAQLSTPESVAVDGAGNLVVASTFANSIRVVAAADGTFYGQQMTAGDIYTIAGTGTAGYAGDGGPATSAQLNVPAAAAVDAAGNLVLADTGNNAIRVVAAADGTFYGQQMTAGDIYTIAGTGTAGYAGDGGPATSAQLNVPAGVAVDAAGNLVLADTGNNALRVVAAAGGTFYGQQMTAGDIYTIAGTGTAGYAGDGGPATSAQLNVPAGAAVDAAGNLVLADTGNSRIRVVAAAGGTFYGQQMTAGDIYTVAGTGIPGYTGDGKLAAQAELNAPQAVTLDGAGNLVIADTGNYRVRVVAARTGTFYGRSLAAGHIYTIAGSSVTGFFGDQGPATAALLSLPCAAAVDAAGNLVIADTGDNRIRVVAESTGTFYRQQMTAGDIYTIAGTGAPGYSGDGGPAATAKVRGADGVTADGAGNLVIADTGNNRIRIVAESTGTFYAQQMTAGDIYTIAGTGTAGYTGDGGAAPSARLNAPVSVAMDGAGNVVVADSGNNAIRVLAAADGGYYGQQMTAGDIYTIAGTGTPGYSGDGAPAASATLYYPQGIAVDTAGNLVIADTGNNAIRVVAAADGGYYGQQMTAGDIYTIAGTGARGFSGDGAPAAGAALAVPASVAVDGAGNLVIADYGNNRVRVVAAADGGYYGQQMTAGDIYTIAGTGTPGYSGDGGPAASAALHYPQGVAVDGAGDVLVTDSANNRLRMVTG